MKSIDLKALITLLVITMSLCATFNRENKSTSKTSSKTQTKTKSDGSGTWADGYDSPRIDITPIGGSKVETGRYTFKPAQMGSWNDGFEIEQLVPTTPAQKDIMVSNAPGGKIYIPWRFIDEGDVENGKWTLSNKWLSFKVTTDSNTTYQVVLVMPWAAWSTYITTTQVTTIQNTIITKVTSAKNEIKKTKTSLKTNVQELANEMANKQKASADQAAIKQKAIADNQAIKASLDAKAQQLNAIKIQINTKNEALAGLISQRDTLNTETSNLGNEIDGDTILLDAPARQKAVAEAGAKIEQIKKDVTHEINSIKGQAPDAYCVTAANEAQTATFALDSNALVAAFKKIYSWNEAKP
jgi:hypothetical protein